MKQTFSYNEARNMVSAVCGTYVTKLEVIEHFNEKFEENKIFEPEELKQIVRDITTGKERISGTLGKNFKFNPRTNKGNKGGEER